MTENKHESPEESLPSTRDLARSIAEQADQYRGDEQSYQRLMTELALLEQKYHEVAGIDPKKLLASERLAAETRVSVAETGSPDFTVDALMDRASGSLRTLLRQKGGTEDLVARLGMHFSKINGVLAPPGKGRSSVPGSGEGMSEIRFEPRWQSLILELNKRGIFSDDIIVREGVVSDDQWRKQSYVLIEIPRLGKEVLICNQVGEATFVSQRILGPETYLRLNKEELAELPGVTRLHQHDVQLVIDALFAGVNEAGKKVNISQQEQVRKSVQARYTSEQFCNFTQAEIRTLCIDGMKAKALCAIFGVTGDPYSRYVFLQLGRGIWGAGDPHIAPALQAMEDTAELKNNPEKLRAAIQAEVSPEQWVSKAGKNRHGKIVGLGLDSIQKTLGTDGGSPYLNLGYYRLGAGVYGTSHPLIRPKLDEAEEMERLSREMGANPRKWRKAIRQTMSAAEWVSMSQPERNAVSICGAGRDRLGSIFGIHSETHLHLTWIQIGAAVWGEKHPDIVSELTKLKGRQDVMSELGTDPELWREEIVTHSTREEWMKRNRTERRNAKVLGVSINFLGKSVFKTGDDPRSNSVDYENLCNAIFDPLNSVRIVT